MPTDLTEAALGAYFELFLTRDGSPPASNGRKVQEEPVTYEADKGVGYLRGQSSNYNAEFALDEVKFWRFINPFHNANIAHSAGIVVQPQAS